MSKTHTILDLNEYVKLARELDILGDYEKALSKYKTALNIVTQRKSEVTDLSLKDKWSQVENLIKNEIIMTHEALKIARTFQNSDETRLERARQEEMRNNQILMRDNEEPKNEIKQQKNFVDIKKTKKSDFEGEKYENHTCRELSERYT